MEVSEQHVRGSMEGLVVGALKSVAFNRRAGQGARLGYQVFDVLMGNVECVVVEQLIDPEQEIQQGAEPCEPGIAEQQLDEFVRRADSAVDTFVRMLLRHNQRAIEREEALVYVQHGAAQGIGMSNRIGW